MKKISLRIICITILSLIGINITTFIKDNATVPYMFQGGLTAKKEGSTYIITVTNVGKKNKYIHFSEDRKILRTKGIVPLKTEHTKIYAGMKMTDVIEKNGEPHVDIGSGLYIPAYITENAYLISIVLENDGTISRVLEEDLLAGQGDGSARQS